jgi:hypothetical protein
MRKWYKLAFTGIGNGFPCFNLYLDVFAGRPEIHPWTFLNIGVDRGQPHRSGVLQKYVLESDSQAVCRVETVEGYLSAAQDTNVT